MAKSKFKIAFKYEQQESNKLPQVEGATQPTTTCTVSDITGKEVAKATIALSSAAKSNRLIARKIAFNKAMNTVAHPGLRTKLWAQFRDGSTILPEHGRVKLRLVESLIDKLPTVSVSDANEIKELLRAAVAPKAKLKPMVATEQISEVA
tara:strand:+ start:10915 stop:11364 length:450 start_codon:yes stop_codon:yes gene_type:complete